MGGAGAAAFNLQRGNKNGMAMAAVCFTPARYGPGLRPDTLLF